MSGSGLRALCKIHKRHDDRNGLVWFLVAVVQVLQACKAKTPTLCLVLGPVVMLMWVLSSQIPS